MIQVVLAALDTAESYKEDNEIVHRQLLQTQTMYDNDEEEQV